ncbi:protein MpPPR_61 [Marchantia polymorpha subsp. ruderalis]
MNGLGIHPMEFCASVLPRSPLYTARIGSAEEDHCTRLWLDKVHVSVDAPLGKLAHSSGIHLFVRAGAKTKKALRDALEREKEKEYQREKRELLAQVRNRKKLAWLQREQVLSQDECEVQKVWPFWRKKKKSELDDRAMTKEIVELSKKQQLDQVFKLIEEAKKEKEGWTPNIIIMNTVVAACVRCHDIDRAIQVYQEMIEDNGCGVDNVTYGTLLRGLGEARRLDDAFELVETIVGGQAPGSPKLTDVHLNTLVNACVEAGDSLRAKGVLLRYRSSVSKTGPSTLTYNLLIKGCARSDKPLEALKLKEEMINQGLQPQRLTYNSLIFACLKGGDMDQAFELLKEMKLEARRLNTSRLLPDVVTYTTLLKGAAHGNIDSVLKLVAEMKRSPTVVLDRIAYTAIIDACIAAQAPEEGLRFLEEMKELAKSDPHMKPKSHAFLALMRAYAENGDIEMVRNLKQQMVPLSAGNVTAEDRAQADELLIEAAVNLGQVGLARQLLRTMVGLKKGIPLTNRAHMVLVRLQTLVGFGDNLFKPYMLKAGISPYDTVESIMVPYEEARPLLAETNIKTVMMRFFKEDAIPVIDEQGGCVGVVYSEDIFEIDVRLRDVMRGPPPDVTTSTLILRAVGLLLEPQIKLLAVVSSRTVYSSTKNTSRELPLGFITRDTIFSLGQCQPIAEALRTQQVSEQSVQT